MEVTILDRIKIQQIVQRCVSAVMGDTPVQIKVEFKRSLGLTAGLAYGSEKRIVLNEKLFLRNKGDFFSEIIPHEVAHILQDILCPEEVEDHGKCWKELMHILGLPANVYHNLDVSAVEKKIFRYSCCCEGGFLFHFKTHKEHAKLQSGAKSEDCILCRKRIVFYPQGDN
jgi:SprT protein